MLLLLLLWCLLLFLCITDGASVGLVTCLGVANWKWTWNGGPERPPTRY